MTRWARGKDANKKKPMEASSWSEMKFDKITTAGNDLQELNTGALKKHKFIVKGNIKRLLEDSEDEMGSKPKQPKKSAVIFPEVSSEFSLVKELESQKVRGKKSTNLVEVHVLEEFVRKDRRRENRRLKRQDVKLQTRLCFNCRQPGHILTVCPLAVHDVDQGAGICFKCGSTEHAVQQCKAKVPHGKFPFAKCFICKEMGHLSRSCPDNPKGLFPNGGSCNHCGSVEHYKRDCPELQLQKVASDTTLPVLDSRTNVDEESTLKPVAVTASGKKKTKVVKF